MESAIIKMFILGKLKEFITKEVYQKEIVLNGSKGIDKLDAVLDGFWDKFDLKSLIEDIVEQGKVETGKM